MSGRDTIQAVLTGRPQTGWAIYKMSPIWAGLMFVVKLAYTGGFAFGSWILVRDGSWHQDQLLLGGSILLGVCALVALLYFIKQLWAILFFKRSLIVLTDKALVKSWCGRIEEYPYDTIHDLRLVRIQGRSRPYTVFPEHYMEFTDQRTGKVVEIARNRAFGRADRIYQVLSAKLA